MNILKFEMRRNLLSTLIWALSLGGFGYFCIRLFTMFMTEMEFFSAMMNAMPADYLTMFGADMKMIMTLPGFYSFCFMYILMCGAFQALYLGITLTGRELSEKSAEFLYTKPQKRWKILTCKFVAGLICIVLLNIVYDSIVLLAAGSTSYDYNVNLFMMINFAMFLTQLLFLCLGFFLGCVLKKIKSPLSMTSGIISVFFMIQMLVNLKPDSILSHVSFLSYVSANSIVRQQAFDPVKVSLLLCLSLLFFMGGYLIFQRRDIQSA